MSHPTRPSTAAADGESAAALRKRAELLIGIAEAVERQRVMELPDFAVRSSWGSSHAGMCERMLRRNLHQLHRSAEELRSAAHGFRELARRKDRIVAA